MAATKRNRIPVCAGFDGSSTSDHTALRLEIVDGWQFTPRYGPSSRPTIWDPTQFNGRIPRDEVHVAVRHIFLTYAVERLYADPYDWKTEIETWEIEYGEEHVFQWDTGRGQSRVPMVHSALERFVTDLTTGALSHDDCPITTTHMANARKIAKPGDRYILAKPNQHQKIDAAMASVLAHEAACDARVTGWRTPTKSRTVVRR